MEDLEDWEQQLMEPFREDDPLSFGDWVYHRDHPTRVGKIWGPSTRQEYMDIRLAPFDSSRVGQMDRWAIAYVMPLHVPNLDNLSAVSTWLDS